MKLPIEDIKIDDKYSIKVDVLDELGMFEIYKEGNYLRSTQSLELALLDIVTINDKHEGISDEEFSRLVQTHKKETFQKLHKMAFEFEKNYPDQTAGLAALLEGSDNFKLPFFRGYPQNYFKPSINYNLWLSKKCSDPECSFFAERPEKSLQNKI